MNHSSPPPHRALPRLAWLLPLVLASLIAGLLPAPVGGESADRQSASANLQWDAPSGWEVIYRRAGWRGGAAVDLRAAGDLMLGRYVGAAFADRPAELFGEVAELLDGDVSLANLESPLTERAAERPGPYRLVASPDFAPALRDAGLDILGLANNHALDAGPAGLADAVAALREAGLQPAGVVASESGALSPVMLERNGLRVAVLAFNDVTDPADGPAPPRSGLASWKHDITSTSLSGVHGRAWLSPAALAAVKEARSASDLVVVLVHWGVEYQGEPSLRQRAWAERLVAAGADLVLGAHPHVPQPAQLVAAGGRSGFVAYSLGNLVFDGPDDPARNSGLVLRALLDREGVALVATAPVTIRGGRPSPAPMQNGRSSRLATASVVAPYRGTPICKLQAASCHRSVPSSVAAWRWDGAAGAPIAAPPDLALGPRPAAISADLRGSGEPSWATLGADGVLTLRDGPAPDAPILWRNEAPGWRITRMAAGDPNDDGRVELLLLLWQPDSAGALRSHPFLLGWRGGRYRIIWGGSATAVPIQDLAVADLEGDGRGELVVLEGGAQPGDPGAHVSVWRWHGWGFQLEWRSQAGSWSSVCVVDLDGDGKGEIAAVSR